MHKKNTSKYCDKRDNDDDNNNNNNNNNNNRREREVGSYPENSIVGDSKDTRESTVPVRRRKRVTWDPW